MHEAARFFFALSLTVCACESGSSGDSGGSTGGASSSGGTTDPSASGTTTDQTSSTSEGTIDGTTTDATGSSGTTGSSGGSSETGSGTDPSTSSGTTGESGPVYPPCEFDPQPMCEAPFDFCHVFGGGSAPHHCSYSCESPKDCPTPDSGDAAVICGGVKENVCMLDCEDATCPDGMTCIGTGPNQQLRRCAYN